MTKPNQGLSLSLSLHRDRLGENPANEVGAGTVQNLESLGLSGRVDEKQQAEDIRTQAMERQEKKATQQKENHSTKRVVRGRTKIQE